MSYFRSYFEKNNTIIKDSVTNTAKNPTTEIFYGDGFSKFIFKVNLTDLKSKVDNGDYVLTTGTTHTLNLTNTIFGDETFLGAKRSTGRQRTNSFDLILFKVNEFWDEGLGFDYEESEYDYTNGNITYDERPSNWFRKTTLTDWTTEGIYNTNPDLISTIHFETGNEDIKLDITNYVNNILTGGTNHGLGLAFSVPYQNISTEFEQSVSFFTKYTQTFFEPFVETLFDDRIDDDRSTFIEKVTQNLYLYVTKGTNFYDLDILPTVDILDSANTEIPSLTGLTTTKIRKGVYKVSFGLDGVLCDGKRFFFDKWKELELDGISISDVKQKFIPKPYTSLFTVGDNPKEYNRYVVQFYGIKQSEKILRGEKRKVVVNFKSINNPITSVFDKVFYRMYIKEGKTNVVVHDWTQTDNTNENSFILDTAIYIPREYYIEIKGQLHGEEIFFNEEIKFELLSERASVFNSATIADPTPTPTATPTPTTSPTPTPTPTATSTATPTPTTSPTPTPTSTVSPTSTPTPTPTPTSTPDRNLIIENQTTNGYVIDLIDDDGIWYLTDQIGYFIVQPGQTLYANHGTTGNNPRCRITINGTYNFICKLNGITTSDWGGSGNFSGLPRVLSTSSPSSPINDTDIVHIIFTN